MMDNPSDSATGAPRDGKNVVQVQILGQQLPLRTEAEVSELQSRMVAAVVQGCGGQLRERA